MEKMPYRLDMDTLMSLVSTGEVAGSDWQQGLPVLRGKQVLLRELRGGFERFIAWTHRQRTAGTYACFAVTVQGFDTAIGIIQVRQSDRQFETAEWGFAIGLPFWGTGVFPESAALVLDFTFDTLGVRRLEARAAVLNGRGTAALKVGAVQQCILRKSFLRNGEYLDQALFSILASDCCVTHTERPLLTRVH